MMHRTQRLARNNGRICAIDKIPIDKCNPYRKSTKSHGSFIVGYNEEMNRK